MPSPASKKRKLNRNLTPREKSDSLSLSNAYDIDAWLRLINQADKECSLEDQRYILAAFLKIFPTAARQWKYLIELEMHHQNYDTATDLFKQCLNNRCYDVELYQVYIALCRKINEGSTKDVFLKNINQAFQFAIKQIGQDIKSTVLWRNYLSFLKSNASKLNSKHDIKDITLEIRKVYQAAIKLPIEECERLWDEYIFWEKSKNEILAQAYHDKLKHIHELTKQCYLDRKRWRRGIIFGLATVPSNNVHTQERNYNQIQLWKRFIDLELLNKQSLDKTELLRRMEFTFRQSLMTMSLFPDIWLMYVEWTKKNRGIERTEVVYKQCLKRIPNCLLIQFKYLEFLELHKSVKETDDAYLSLLNKFADNTLIKIQYLYFLRRCKSTAAARNWFLSMIQKQDGLWQLFVAESYIEENLNNEIGIAHKIYSNGFKYFKDKPEFVLCYVQFLMNQKDESSKSTLRRIFDNTLPQLNVSHKDTQRIWKLHIEFEQRLCDLKELHRIESKRNNELLCGRIDILLNDIERFTFLDLLPVSKQYRDTLIHAKQTTQRKATQKMNVMQSKTMMDRNANNANNNLNKTRRPRPRKSPTSQIKINAFQSEGANKSFVDMTTSNTNGKEMEMVTPDLSQLHAFKPGIRFLQKMDSDDEDEDEDDDDAKLTETLPPKIKELLGKLPPPQHTQLLKLDKNTSMIDVEPFLTFMKLKLCTKDIL